MSAEHSEYLFELRRKARRVRAARILLLLIFLAFWEAAGRVGLADPFIVSSPVRVCKTIASLWKARELFTHTAATFLETAAGFTLGTAAGVATAVLLWFCPTLERVLDPYLVVLNALPKIALGPILIVWVGAGAKAIIVMALLVSTVVTVMSVLAGFIEKGREKELLMRSLGASRAQFFIKAVLPGSVPNMMSALKISVGMSWVGVIVGEYLVSKRGLGYLIVYGGQVFRLDLVYAGIVILCALAALMYYGVAAVEKAAAKRF
ncbi:MAG: ABC transporter permease [Clostridia bacterium]|nr:ABC transporter permease [Clostridia bacterium]